MPAVTMLRVEERQLGGSSAENLYARFQKQVAGRGSRGADLETDLAAVEFVRPDGVIALIGVARYWQRIGGRMTCLKNMPAAVHAYLERLDLFSECSSFIRQDRELKADQRYTRSLESRTLLEVTPISGDPERNEQDVHRTLKRTGQVLRARYGEAEGNIHRLLHLISELATNVVHSRDAGYVVMQSYSRHEPMGSQVEVGISDLGIGIEASLKSKHRLRQYRARTAKWKGSDYILLALKEGITSESTRRGIGLSSVRKVVSVWNGVLTIRSNASQVRIAQSGEPEISDDLTPIPGTQVTIKAKGVFRETS